jgi:hypothetical protein
MRMAYYQSGIHRKFEHSVDLTPPVYVVLFVSMRRIRDLEYAPAAELGQSTMGVDDYIAISPHLAWHQPTRQTLQKLNSPSRNNALLVVHVLHITVLGWQLASSR